MHSWRVLILPYLGPGEAQLYKQYNFDEPWNSAKNLQFVDQCPAIYRCQDGNGQSTTDYMAIVGEGTAWPPRQGLKFDAIDDRPSQTVMLIAMTGIKVNWMEPVDMNIDELMKYSDEELGKKALILGFADGSIRFCKGISKRTLKALTTIDGDEKIDMTVFEE